MREAATGDNRQATAHARFACCLVAVLVLGGCSRGQRVAADAGPSADAATDTGATVSVDGKALVAGACLSCHSEPMLAQQRLTPAQWHKTVTKMVGWGANLEPTEIAPLVAYLSASYGPDAGPYTPETISATEALAEIAPLPDDPFPPGDPERGKALYAEKCAACHGPDARGHIGVTLVDRPFLYRAGDFAQTVRRGRGKMPPVPLSNVEIGDVLAHLRRSKNPAP